MEFQLVQNRAAHENTAFLQGVSCCKAGTLVEMQCWDACGDAMLGRFWRCNAGIFWRCNAGMFVEMLGFNEGFGVATGQIPTDQSNNASSSVQKELEVGTIQNRNEYRTHLRRNHATIEAKRMFE